MPDVVAGGAKSLELSLHWLAELGRTFNSYIALQEGTHPSQLPDAALWGIDGWFIGGASWDWKVEATQRVQAWRPSHPCGGDQLVHVGRVGSARRIRWARAEAVHSVDSCMPLWSSAHWRRAMGALLEA